MTKTKKYPLFLMTIALFGEIYFYPFNSLLRFSAGIIALNMIILIDEDISPFSMCFFSGIATFSLRNIIHLVSTSMPLREIIFLHFPSIIYYITYGCLCKLSGIRKYKNNFVLQIMILATIDTTSNMFEGLIRNKSLTLYFIQMFIVVGFIRSLIAYFIYSFYKKQEFFILAREHQKRYSQLNVLIADIQAEMFYLKKSAHDMETVMTQSYALYENYKQNKELKEQTLDIARGIHEIKKDYYRVLHGFESFLKIFEKNGSMMLSDMLIIIRENTYRYIDQNNQNISISFNFKDNFQLLKYYHLFTILNNLIINAIDACTDQCEIKILEESHMNHIIFYVIDNGEGIDENILPYIFNPGFTTKYNEKSGISSTGIGLSHVKNIVDELQGTIEVQSTLNKITTFKVVLPKNSLIG